MDKTELVAADLKKAWRVVSAIEKAGLPVVAAVAVRSWLPDAMRIVIASPDVKRHGPSAVIRFVDRVLRELRSSFRIGNTDIVNQQDKIVRQVADYFGGRKSSYHFGTSKSPITLRVFNDDHDSEGIILLYNSRAHASEAPPAPDEAALTRARAA